MYLANSVSFFAFLLAGCAVVFGLSWEVSAVTLWTSLWLSVCAAVGAFVLVTAFQFLFWYMSISPGRLAEAAYIYASTAISLSALEWQFPVKLYLLDVWSASLCVTSITVLLGLLAAHKVFNQHWFPCRKKSSEIN